MILKLARLVVVLGVLAQSSSALAIKVCAANVEIAFKVPDGRLALTPGPDGRSLAIVVFDTSTAASGKFRVASTFLPLAPKLQLKSEPGQIRSVRFVSDGKESPLVSGWEGLGQSAIALLYTIQTSLSFETDTDGDMRLLFAPEWEYMLVPVPTEHGSEEILGGLPPATVAKSWGTTKAAGNPKPGWTWNFKKPLTDKEKQELLIGAVPCVRRFYLIRIPHEKSSK